MSFKAKLRQFVTEDAKAATHYSLSGGKYAITDDNNKEVFLNMYTDAFENSESLDIVEKPLPLKPILIDFDFKTRRNKHVYTNDDILAIIEAFILIFHDYFVKKVYTIYVYEKPPRYDDKSGKYKDGLHIIVPEIVCSAEVQLCIRNKFIEKYSHTLTNLDVINSIQDIYDISVIKSNGWLMYGSKKPEETNPWKVTQIFEVDEDKDEVIPKYITTTDKSYIRTLSIREALNTHGETTLSNIAQQELDAKKKCSSVKDSVFSIKSTIIKTKDIDFTLLEEVVMGLNIWRAESYDMWTIIIWAIKNIAETNGYIDKGLELSHAFSQQTTKENYDEDAVVKLYDSGRKSDLGFGTLMMFLKEDNLDLFKRIKFQKNKLRAPTVSLLSSFFLVFLLYSKNKVI